MIATGGCGRHTFRFDRSALKTCTLHSTLELKGKLVNVYYAETCKQVIWHPYTQEEMTIPAKGGTIVQSISLSDTFAITYESEHGKNRKSKSFELLPGTVFCIHHIKREKSHRWKGKMTYFHCSDSQECQSWVKSLNDVLKTFDRPKRLLIFVNPVGGRKLAKKVFSEKVSPLFDVAGIRQDVIVTERARHAEEYILSCDLEPYDGIISVGGDGMFSEVLNGFLKKTADLEEHGDHKKVRKKIRLGVIPAGSTDTVVFCTVGNNDPVTSALHVLIGDRLPLDVCSVWHNQSIVRYCVSLMGYGFFGDVMKSSERLRWMGPRRYDMAGFMKFMANKSYYGEISYLPAPPELADPKQFDPCRAGCQRCTANLDEEVNATASWKTVRGKFISVIGANITCRCAKSLNGISPGAHIGDGFIDLILIRNTSRGQYLRHMVQLANRGDPFDFHFVEVFRVREFSYKPLYLTSGDIDNLDDIEDAQIDLVNDESDTSNGASDDYRNRSLWNVDGELLEEPCVRVVAHRQLVSIFARGIEDEDLTASCAPCKKVI